QCTDDNTRRFESSLRASTEEYDPTHGGMGPIIHAPGPQQPRQIIVKVHLAGIIKIPGDLIEVQIGQIQSRERLLIMK
ncbi:MAG: hypothetical protein ACT4NY_16500, partial [Pseudonocardiales bacterium]